MSALYEFGPFTLEPEEERLLRGGSTVSLTPKAFDTLVCLVRRAGTLVDKDALMREVWPDAHVEDANITVNISTIRKALGEGVDGQRYIETIPKRGYRFIAPVVVTEVAPRMPTTAILVDPAFPVAPPTPAPVTVPAAGTDAPATMGRRGFWLALAGSVPLLGAAAGLASLWRSRETAPRNAGFPWERMATQGKLRLLLASESGAASATLVARGTHAGLHRHRRDRAAPISSSRRSPAADSCD